MADVLRPVFGRKNPVLTGFIPADLGRDTLEKRKAEQLSRARKIALIAFAKQGGPIISNLTPKQEEEGIDQA